jgi:aromatic-amino-acid transaminase
VTFLIPSRQARPSDDPIFALNAEAKAAAARGERVVNATVGALLDDDGRIATLGGVVDTLRDTPAQVGAGYAPISGAPDFLRGVTDDLLGRSHVAKWATAAATPGGTGALHLAIVNFLGLGESLLTTSFFWGPYKTLADESDRKLRTFNMFDADRRLDVDDFARQLDAALAEQGRALVLLNSPCHNPTGYSFDADEWRALRRIVEERSSRGPIAVCLDVAYARFGAQPLDSVVEEMAGLLPKTLLLFAWSASKTFLQYGLRVGALVAVHPDEEERKRIAAALSYSCRGTWSNCNAGGMAAIARVLNDPERKARVDAERDGFVGLLARRVARFNELATQAKLVYPRYDGGFFTTVFTKDAPQVAEALKADGIFVVPQAGALRIALCSVAERDVPHLVASLARHVKPA